MKTLLKATRMVFIGYCVYKTIDATMEKKKVKEVEDEYVSFDELEVKEEPKKDNVKNAIMFASGMAVATMLRPKHRIQPKETIVYYVLK